jgi:hypothetical protein
LKLKIQFLEMLNLRMLNLHMLNLCTYAEAASIFIWKSHLERPNNISLKIH